MQKNYHQSWEKILLPEFESDYFYLIEKFIDAEKGLGKIIYPQENDIFNAFSSTSFENLKVVILGQDPYHGANQAHGLSFSVQKGQKIPPSLKNIFKELSAEYGFETPLHGDLSSWAQQGVLLLNTILTVEENKPASHEHIGWGKFTDHIISKISEEKSGIIFLLWGKFAQTKSKLIDPEKHIILETSHPSPFSAHRGFLGSQCFQECNSLLEKYEKTPIDWQIQESENQMKFKI
ncbi:MAG: uracil-DNA glycosylase [Candidatus Gracilibacteria bacterium]|nr:uracil-DNA glycosylase [Candidatus Gracilibacteria bacterium]